MKAHEAILSEGIGICSFTSKISNITSCTKSCPGRKKALVSAL